MTNYLGSAAQQLEAVMVREVGRIILPNWNKLRLHATLCLVGCMISVASTDTIAGTVWWDASSGLLPSDLSIPAANRFAFSGSSGFVSLHEGALRFADNSTSLQANFQKNDVVIGSGDQWAFQVEIRTTSHNRPFFDFAALTGIHDTGRSGRLAIANDKVGFAREDGLGFINNAYVSVDTTDGFHVFMATKTLGMVHLFVDDIAMPALSLPYDALDPSSTSFVDLAQSSNPGTAIFQVRSFAYNLNSPDIVPIPSPLSAGAAFWAYIALGAMRIRRPATNSIV